MMDLGTINALVDEATQRAKYLDEQPLVYDGDPDTLQYIPFLGDYVPKGWEVALDFDNKPIEYFVDSSGWGQKGERAFTFEQFTSRATEGLGYGIRQAGQFQVYIREYVRAG